MVHAASFNPAVAMSDARPLRIAVLISGGGSTLANLIQRLADGRLKRTRIVQVVSSRADAGGVEIAARAGLPVEIVRRRDYSDDAAFGTAMGEVLRRRAAQIVVLGGYLTLLPVPAEFRRRVLNIHPALLPAFGGPGMFGHRVHEAVLAARVREAGCTVHLVDEQYDHGPIIAQARTGVRPDDTPDSLAARVVALERELYPAVIQSIADAGPGWLDRPECWPSNDASRASPAVDGAGGGEPARTRTEGGRRQAAGTPPGPESKAYACRICGRVVAYEGRLPALHPFCSPRCRWVDLGRWFRGQYSIDSDLPPDFQADDSADG